MCLIYLSLLNLCCVLQGQMDEDVQKALKQILMMCKMPSQAKEACWDTPGLVSQKHVVNET